MSTLLLRLSGPLQSWGTRSRFEVRDTGAEPTKSGVLGLVAAAQGRQRTADISDLTQLRFGVRVIREGLLQYDYHTAQNVACANTGMAKGNGRLLANLKKTVESWRYFLCEADFLVGLEGERSLLEELDSAIRKPCYSLYLGRKSFVPAMPVYIEDGIVDKDLRTALIEQPLEVAPQEEFRLVIETEDHTVGNPRYDVPLNFALHRFTGRYVSEEVYRAQCWIGRANIVSN